MASRRRLGRPPAPCSAHCPDRSQETSRDPMLLSLVGGHSGVLAPTSFVTATSSQFKPFTSFLDWHRSIERGCCFTRSRFRRFVQSDGCCTIVTQLGSSQGCYSLRPTTLPIPGNVQATSPPLRLVSFLDGSRDSDSDPPSPMFHVCVCTSTTVDGRSSLSSSAIRPCRSLGLKSCDLRLRGPSRPYHSP